MNDLNTTREIISDLKHKKLDIIEINKPPNIEYAKYLAKIISKLSPLIGNLIEYSIVDALNNSNWTGQGRWVRQDPGFPDTLFDGNIFPQPGIEVKTWFPLATEITARFKDSVRLFEVDQTDVALVAWLPEYMLYGKPKIIDVWLSTAKSLAMARDIHYHNPPDYLVLEPEDTSSRTSNLQQTNTNGYKFQGTSEQLTQAKAEVERRRLNRTYSFDAEYQKQVRRLMGQYSSRIDTNFAKIDRIQHKELEDFKQRVLLQQFKGFAISEWKRNRLKDEETLKELLKF